MAQNDIVAKILQMIQGGELPQMPSPPQGIMPPSGLYPGPDRPEMRDSIALQMARGQFPEAGVGMQSGEEDDPLIRQLIEEQLKLMTPQGVMPQNNPLAPSHMQMNGYQQLKKFRQGGGGQY